MDADQVVALLDILAADGIPVWIGGGWAVDAVLGRQTRPHGDLDIAVDATRLDGLFAVLRGQGFVRTVDWLPVRAELAAPDGRRVDVHPVVFAADGHGVQAGLDGTSFSYPAGCFGAGVIAGRRVPCLTVAQQLRFREGYPPRDVDHHDIALLRGLSGGDAGR